MDLTSLQHHPLGPELIHIRLKIGSWTTFYTIDTTIKGTLCESGSCPSHTPSAPEDLSEISIRSGGQSLNAYERANMFSTRRHLEAWDSPPDADRCHISPSIQTRISAHSNRSKGCKLRISAISIGTSSEVQALDGWQDDDLCSGKRHNNTTVGPLCIRPLSTWTSRTHTLPATRFVRRDQLLNSSTVQ